MIIRELTSGVFGEPRAFSRKDMSGGSTPAYIPNSEIALVARLGVEWPATRQQGLLMEESRMSWIGILWAR